MDGSPPVGQRGLPNLDSFANFLPDATAGRARRLLVREARRWVAAILRTPSEKKLLSREVSSVLRSVSKLWPSALG